MNIIIVGAGKTGATLAEDLSGEGHNVTVIDLDQDRLEQIGAENDILCIPGDGLNNADLSEAGIEEADVFIAVTGSDEQNLLSCLFAGKNQNCATIARVRNPMFIKENAFIRDRIGLSMIINPELAAATEISRLLRFPSAIEINTFAKGRLEQLTFKIPSGSVLDGKNLTYVRTKIEKDLLVCSVERGGEFYIPSGNFELKSGDKVSVVIAPRVAQRFFRHIGIDTHKVPTAMIVGGGMMTHYLADQLLNHNIGVKIIESDRERCEELNEKFPAAIVINGDATDKKLLLEEGVEDVGAFVAISGIDEENILLSLFVKEVSDAKTVTKVNRIAFNSVIAKLDLDSVIYPRSITAEYILQFVRAKQNAVGSNVENLYKLVEDKVEALEFKIREDAPIIGVPLSRMRLKDNVLICGISRARKIIIPGGSDTIQAGDSVIVVTSHKHLNDVSDILA
ncbi:MAG: Trk system potassium transporter TrkA [Clostridia bacterium]|nr:Trk system potassium transporter TrkA [Clostridia bacterium]